MRNPLQPESDSHAGTVSNQDLPGSSTVSALSHDGRDVLPATLAPVPVTRGLSEPAGQAQLSPIAQVGRYPIYGELGRGGMGAVLRGRDPTLNRDLAVKVLLSDYSAHPQAVQRFEIEAQIGGRLQHPGVVPVYELGRVGAGGQPYFTMKLVEGVTLDTLLRQRPNPAHDLPRFLKVFEQVCQAVAYAHAQKVIHRDLKPSNVMVGAFGEVQVMDWGLAKQMQSAELAKLDPTQVAAAGDGAYATRVGAALGTPAFMPPEQARGEIDALDERSDVFGLGGILCVVLTGGPVYMSPDLMVKAQRGEVTECFARLAACGADAELTDLAYRCLAPERAARPADGKEVADAVAAYLAGVQERLKRVELERAAAEARAAEERAKLVAERRARRMTLGLAVAVILLLGIGGWIWRQREQQTRDAQARQDRIDDRAQDAISQVRSDLDASWRANNRGKLAEVIIAAGKVEEEALANDASFAHQAAAQALRELSEQRLRQVEKNNFLLTSLLDGFRGEEYGEMVQNEKGQMVLQYTGNYADRADKAFAAWGLKISADRPVAELAAYIQDQPDAFIQEVVIGLDEWTSDLLQRGEAKHEKLTIRLRELAETLDNSPVRQSVRKVVLDRSFRNRRALLAITHEFLPWSTVYPELVSPYVSQLRELADRLDLVSESALNIASVARALHRAGDTGRAIELVRRANTTNPGEVVLNLTLAGLLQALGYHDSPEVIERLQAARQLRPDMGRDLAFLLHRIARATEGEAILRDLLRRHPNSSELHEYLGNYLMKVGRLEEAEQFARKGITLTVMNHQIKGLLGAILYHAKRYDEAAAVFEDVMVSGTEFQFETRLWQGWAFFQVKRYVEAAAAFRAALDLRPGHLAVQEKLIETLHLQRKPAEVLEACNAYESRNPNNTQVWYYRASSLMTLNKYAEAEPDVLRLIDRLPDYHTAHYMKGEILFYAGRFEPALSAFQVYRDRQPSRAAGHVAIGNCCLNLQRHGEALQAYRKALDIDSRNMDALVNTGTILRLQGKHGEALVHGKKAIEIDNHHAPAHHLLGCIHFDLKEYDSALVSLRQAMSLDPERFETWRVCCDTLLRMKKLEEAVVFYRQAKTKFPNEPNIATDLARFERALELDRQISDYRMGKYVTEDALEWLQMAGRCESYHKDYQTALKLCREAIGRQKKASEGCFLVGADVALKCAYFDTKTPDADTQLALRKQAFVWMQTGVRIARDAVGASMKESVQFVTDYFLTGKSFAPIRDEPALSQLPEPERKEWQKLWADIAALQKKLGQPE